MQKFKMVDSVNKNTTIKQNNAWNDYFKKLFDKNTNKQTRNMDKKTCRTCGIIMKINKSQTRKKMCSKCAYDIKKIRSSESYWNKKDKGSTRHKYWRGRLREFEKMLNN